MSSPHRVPPPGVASSISRGSFRDTRVANDFSPFGVDDFNSANPATKQVAPGGSPFLHGVRPGSLHTNGTPMHRGGVPALSRRDSMESFYADAPMHSRARPPHPDDVFSDDGSQYHGQATPYVAHNQFGSGHDSQIGMSVHGATPQGHHGHLQPDDNSVRYGSLYGEPYEPKRQSLHPQDIPHKQSFQTNGSKLSRSTKLTKKSGLSGFSLRRKPKQPPMSEEGSEFHGTPYMGHGHNTASIISERGNIHQTPKPSRSPSILSQHQEIFHNHAPARSQSLLSAQPSNMVRPESIMVHDPPGTSMHRHRRGGSTYAGHDSLPETRPISMRDSIRSIHKAAPGAFPFERDGDDIVAQVWLPWTAKLQERPCHFHVDGMHGDRYWIEVDYRWTKAINGTAKFHGGGVQHSGSHGRGRFIVEWEIAFQFEPEVSRGASDGLFRNSVSA